MHWKRGLRSLGVDAAPLVEARPRRSGARRVGPLLPGACAVSLSLVIGIALPCGGAMQGKACANDDGCGKGEICSDRGECIDGCRVMADCAPNEVCRNNRCTTMRCDPGNSWPCYDGPPGTASVGLCRKGVQFCRADGTFSGCFQQVIPQIETCDREDNDCDGSVDEGIPCDCIPGQRRECYGYSYSAQGVGECKTGMQYCLEDRRWGECHDDRAPLPEVCDGKDNDCDGQTDEGLTCECTPGAIRECYSHPVATNLVGECHKGRQPCKMDYTWYSCIGEQGPVPEVCGDGKDNDCDGTVDNGCLRPLNPMLDKPRVFDPKPLPGSIER